MARGDRLLVVVVLGCIAPVSACDVVREETKAPISIKLEISVVEYDPANPGKASLKCIVTNNLKDTISLPLRYDGKVYQLLAGDYRWDYSLSPRTFGVAVKPVEPKRVLIEPGKEAVVFELPLADIFLPAETWEWNWPARPAAPLSPIYVFQDKTEFLEQTPLWVRVNFDTDDYSSPKVILKVKQPAEKKPKKK